MLIGLTPSTPAWPAQPNSVPPLMNNSPSQTPISKRERPSTKTPPTTCSTSMIGPSTYAPSNSSANSANARLLHASADGATSSRPPGARAGLTQPGVSRRPESELHFAVSGTSFASPEGNSMQLRYEVFHQEVSKVVRFYTRPRGGARPDRAVEDRPRQKTYPSRLGRRAHPRQPWGRPPKLNHRQEHQVVGL